MTERLIHTAHGTWIDKRLNSKLTGQVSIQKRSSSESSVHHLCLEKSLNFKSPFHIYTPFLAVSPGFPSLRVSR